MIDFSTPFQDFNNSRFLKDFLPEDLTLHKEDLIKQSYQKYITEGHILGTVKSLNLSILEFKQTSEHDPRVSLVKEAFRIMADHGVRRGLVIFWNPKTRNWRLSLMTINLDIDEKNKIVRNYSNAKRFSFLLGEGEAMKTPRTQLSGKVKDFEDLQKRFSVEVVRKEFFDDYIDLFIRLYIEISKDVSFVKVLSEQGIDRVKFTKNLLGKIIFVYFVQKKGWLGLDRDKKWGEGDKNFMRSLWERFASGDIFVRPSTGFFYNDYLEHLFYNGFNKDRRDDDGYEPNMRMKVPYLNGGLFKEDYRDWEHFVAEISNDIFSNSVKNGILDIFDTYNFTIDEDDLTDAEIAVDPEMLGKIFEKMISVSKDNIDEIVTLYQEKGKVKIGTELNKKFGAFYTPREIVHYMTRESLITYLSTNTSGKKEDNESKIRSLIDAKDQHLSQTETLQLFSNDTSSISTFAQEVDAYLQKVKIIDPAVGSGAFPMGILHEVTTLRYYLHSEGFCTNHHHETEEGEEELTEDGKVSMYQIKRETIKNSIYGVDIEPGAIDIARLRFWLSLVVDAEHPEPLPNFEFKFVCANTLIPLDEDTSKKQMEFGMLEEANLKTVKRYKREYYNADTKTEKIAIANKLRDYTKLPALKLGDIIPKRSLQIDEFGKNFDNPNHSHTFFDSSLMLSEWRGFDIVIGNPPYIGYKGNGNIFLEIKNTSFGKKYYCKEMDYWYFFAHWGLDLLNKKGILMLITTSYWTTAHGAKKLRETIGKHFLNSLIDFGEMKIFENALGQHNNIFSVTNIKPRGVTILKNNGLNLSNLLNENNLIRFEGDFFDENNNIYFHNSDRLGIINKVKKGEKLFNIAKIGSGIKTGSDFVSNEHILKYNLKLKKKEGIFILNQEEYKELIIKGLEERILGEFFKNSDISKYYISPSKYKILLALDKTDLEDSTIYNHLIKFKDILVNRKARFGKLLNRLDLNFDIKDTIVYKKGYNKIVVPYRANCNQFAFTDSEFYSAEDVYFIYNTREDIDIIYLLALLNSKLYNFYLKNNSKTKGGVIEYTTGVLRNIPIKVVTKNIQEPIIVLVKKIIQIKKENPDANTSDLESEIDKSIYKIYDLTEEEVCIVENK